MTFKDMKANDAAKGEISGAKSNVTVAKKKFHI